MRRTEHEVCCANEEFVERQHLNLTSKLFWHVGKNKKGGRSKLRIYG